MEKIWGSIPSTLKKEKLLVFILCREARSHVIFRLVAWCGNKSMMTENLSALRVNGQALRIPITGVTLTPSCDEDVKEEASCEYFLSFGKLHRIND